MKLTKMNLWFLSHYKLHLLDRDSRTNVNLLSMSRSTMGLALSSEKLINEKLLTLHSVVDDSEMQDFVEREFQAEQV
ncbi:ferritin, chloroplastic-like [Solanum pennellii]|uniref:Ferritin, chloroplastic-like n=1 Tax=Solanum pennellii TaxID=28526 RepID=A0ABM1UYV4_SOLPN|nr:ferritin, chloroplastic-like [Solanum pennellii]